MCDVCREKKKPSNKHRCQIFICCRLPSSLVVSLWQTAYMYLGLQFYILSLNYRSVVPHGCQRDKDNTVTVTISVLKT